MVEPKIFKLRQKVNCQGRLAYIITRERGTRSNSKDRDGIYYGVHHDSEARYPAFVVHQSQIWEWKDSERQPQPIQLVK